VSESLSLTTSGVINHIHCQTISNQAHIVLHTVFNAVHKGCIALCAAFQVVGLLKLSATCHTLSFILSQAKTHLCCAS
jgi:hypothetical protein